MAALERERRGTLEKVERMQSSYYGNPRFRLTVAGETYPTQVDGSVGYEVTNFKVGREIILTLVKGSGPNRVAGMRYADGSRP